MTSRRDLLKGLAAGSLSGLIGPSLLGMTKAAAQGASALGAWHVTGSHWGAIRAYVENGEVARVEPFAYDPAPTDMINGIRGVIYNPSRVRYPMARAARGHRLRRLCRRADGEAAEAAPHA